MNDEAKSVQPSEVPTSASEMAGVHLVSAMIATLFFRWNGSKHSYWQAGDESLIANGIGAMIDIAYWLFKPRIMRWRHRR